MRLIAIACIRTGAGRSQFTGWYADGRPRVRNTSNEIQPGQLFDVDDATAANLIRSGSARALNEAETLLAQTQERKP